MKEKRIKMDSEPTKEKKTKVATTKIALIRGFREKNEDIPRKTLANEYM